MKTAFESAESILFDSIERVIAEARAQGRADGYRAGVERIAELEEALGELAIDHWNSTGYCRRCQVHAGHSTDCSIVVARKALATKR